MEGGTPEIDVALENIDIHSVTLRAAKESTALGEEALAELIAGSLRYHREERARWRKAVQHLPAHLKVSAPVYLHACLPDSEKERRLAQGSRNGLHPHADSQLPKWVVNAGAGAERRPWWNDGLVSQHITRYVRFQY